jgi:cysteine desulfurase
MKPIYLDHNSTTPIDPQVAKVMAECYGESYLNPASQHRPGQHARSKIEQLRARMVAMLGGRSSGMETDQLVITSGGTESNNLALIGLGRAAQKNFPDKTGRILVSAIEHPSVIGASEQLAREGFHVETIPVDGDGVCQLDALEKMLSHDSANPVLLVSLMLANNETGVRQPVAKAAAICRSRNVLIHTDAVQVVGKLKVDFHELGVDALSLTAHKFHGPRGVGGLLIRHGVTVEPILFGGFQQMAIRPGTEDVALTAGMHEALSLFENSTGRAQRMGQLRDRLESELESRFPNLTVNGKQAERMPHTLNLSFPGIDRQAFLLAADIEGLAISTGSACASGSSEPSPVLIAMNANDDVIQGSIRISLGATTTADEIEQAIMRIESIVKNIGKFA